MSQKKSPADIDVNHSSIEQETEIPIETQATENETESTPTKRSMPRVAAIVAIASGTVLLAASIGAAPIMLAGAAGYFTYDKITK